MKASDVINKAINEIGVTEYPPNSNNVKYNTAYYGHPVSGAAYPWCCTFVWWVLKECGVEVLKTASCMMMADYFKKQGRWSNIPQTGDLVFFKFATNSRWTNHVGIVVDVEGNKITTVEGNTSINSDDNGGAVMKRTRTSNIVGYAHPKYDTESLIQTPSAKPILKGVDLSANQGNVDFSKVKASGYDFVILRSTLRNGNPDPKFEEYYTQATACEIPVSVYKYSYATTPAQSFQEAMGVIKLLNGRLCTVWLDMEDAEQLKAVGGKAGITNIINAFMDYCIASGYDVGIYCNLNWYKNYISADFKKKYKFWIARYGKNNGTLEEKYRPDMDWAIWQYTSKGKVNGINGYVDLNIRK